MEDPFTEEKSQQSESRRPRRAVEVVDEAIARAGGSLSVEQFMRLALYDAEIGYYARNVRGVGRRGDFSTSATLSPALGKAIARWAHHRARELWGQRRRHLIEVGAGSGELARTILGAAAIRLPYRRNLAGAPAGAARVARRVRRALARQRRRGAS